MMEWFGLVVVVVTLVLVALRRSIESKFLPGVLHYEHHPILGIWPALFANMYRFYDWKLEQAERAQAQGAELVQRVGPFLGVVEVHSPRMLQYMLKDNFDNFESQWARADGARVGAAQGGAGWGWVMLLLILICL
jgi:hypothetical protein